MQKQEKDMLVFKKFSVSFFKKNNEKLINQGFFYKFMILQNLEIIAE